MKYNEIRAKLRNIEKEQTENSNSTMANKESRELRVQLNNAWSSVILHELFFLNIGNTSTPQPLTQHVMSRQFPTGMDFARTLGRAAKEGTEEGWVAAVFDRNEDRIIVGFIPNNEMYRGIEFFYFSHLIFFSKNSC